MVLLNCALVGVAGSAFPVDIDENKSVGHLKDAIKAKKPNDFKDVDADKLQLFLAKTEGGAWLAGAGVAAVMVDGDGHPQGFELMDPTLWIKNPKHFGANFQPGEGQVHVLVVVPKQGTSAPLVSDGGVFDRCSDPFFSKFQTVDEVNSWLQFPALLPLTERQTLYIRSSYKSIAAQALSKVDPNRRKYAVITG
ncbi:hypothetical protein PC116_g31956, partial [Phytophthora cactorum]